MSIKGHVEKTLDGIRNGTIIETMKQLYDENVVMQENTGEPTVGLAANLEREQQFIDSVKEWTGFDVQAIATDGDDGSVTGMAFVQYSFSFVGQDDQPVTYAQVAVQQWKDGKIVKEQFFHG